MELDGIVAKMAQRAKQDLKTIVLPETEDARVLKAASIILKEEIANIILIGDENEIKSLCEKENIDMSFSKVKIITLISGFSNFNLSKQICDTNGNLSSP